VQNRIFNQTDRISVANFQSWTVHKIIEYVTLAFEISITVQQLTFLDPPYMFNTGKLIRKWLAKIESVTESEDYCRNYGSRCRYYV